MPKKGSMKRKNTDEEEPTSNEQPQPPSKITPIINGQKREYRYMTTVKSLDELNTVRFQNYCQFIGDGPTSQRRHNFTSLIIPCTRKRAETAKPCNFELKAWRPDLESGLIHVYYFSQHNHPLESEAKRSQFRKGKELMAAENPPMVFCTLDLVEWTFLETFPDFDKLNEFMTKKNRCTSISNARNRTRLQLRAYCRSRTKQQCKFMLLAVKTTKQFYHVYKHGEHNHPVIEQGGKQKLALGKQKSGQEQMEDENEKGAVPMEEEHEQEDEPIDREQQHPEDIAQPEQNSQMETEGREYPLEKCQLRLESNLRKVNMERAKKWIGRIDQSEIGRVITDLDIQNVVNLMSMADIDIFNSEARLAFWLPWIKKAIRKRGAELVEFIDRFKELLKVESLPKKLRAKIQKMLDERPEIETQQVMLPDEINWDEENEEEIDDQHEEETGKENEEESGNMEEPRNEEEEEVEVPMEDEEQHEEDEPNEPEEYLYFD